MNALAYPVEIDPACHYILDTVDKSVVLWYNEENAQGCFFMENSYRRHDMSDAMWEILKP